jgi:hypothetical protein
MEPMAAVPIATRAIETAATPDVTHPMSSLLVAEVEIHQGLHPRFEGRDHLIEAAVQPAVENKSEHQVTRNYL